MAVPYTFGSATSSIPLSQLDSNFATGITLGNTTVYLGNTTTSFGNVSLTNVTISSVSTAITPAQGGTGLITIPANNVILGNGTSNVAVVAPGTSGNVLTSNGTTWSSATISAASVSAAGSTTQVQYNNAGAFAGSANLTFNGTTLTAAGLSGPHNGTVGATTPSTGSFTTLAASSTVSGTGFSTYLASPPAIGGTAPAAGAFTTLTATTAIGTSSGGTGLSSFTANAVVYASSSSVLATGSGLVFDGTNLGVGTASPASKLTVYTSSDTPILAESAGGTAYIVIKNSSSSAGAGVASNGNSLFLFTSTSGTEGARLTTTGLGIGTSLPNTKLQVNGNVVIGNGTIGAPASGYQLRITGDGSEYYDFGRNSSTGYFTSNSSQASPYRGFIWAYGGTAQATLDSSGNLLVGRTTTANTTVGSGLYADGIIASCQSGSTNGNTAYDLYSTGASAYRFYVGMGGTIFATSIVISAISDQRLKENVRDIDTGLDAIMALKPRRFDWKEGKGQDKKNVAGFIAQEFETVFPECVGVSKAGADGIEYKNINHETLIPTLVKAIQEQQAMIESLRQRLSAANL